MEFSITGKLFAKHREKFAGWGYPEGPCQPPKFILTNEISFFFFIDCGKKKMV
jgi:hypothetical protein